MSNTSESGRFADIRPDDVDRVTTTTEAAEVVALMLADLRAHPTEWENHTLDRFLEALQSSLEALPWLYRNRGDAFPDQPSWKQFTEALIMATGRE